MEGTNINEWLNAPQQSMILSFSYLSKWNINFHPKIQTLHTQIFADFLELIAIKMFVGSGTDCCQRWKMVETNQHWLCVCFNMRCFCLRVETAAPDGAEHDERFLRNSGNEEPDAAVENICYQLSRTSSPLVTTVRLFLPPHRHAPAWLLLIWLGTSERWQLRRCSAPSPSAPWHDKCFYFF